ncbi:uncharacterized protein isoform X7 [Rhodnius prolixus]|uniref:uncharacterized protein isoform X7 n=1 Tax=Rhodnius prolixus TaxID=13249 RepID=UPI003D18E98D
MHPLLVGILAANCGIMGFDIYLRVRQWKVVNRTTELPPELNEGASVARVFDQIRISTLRRTEMAILYCFYKLIQVTTLLCYYCPSFLWTWTIHHFGNRMWQPVAYVIEESIISDLIRLPLNLIVFLELRRTQQNHKVALLLSSHEGNHADADHVAYFTGMFSSKVIVISLTLILSMTEEEIVAIVAHEMGHWKLRHAWYYLISRAFYNLFLCVLLMNYYDSLKLYNAFNIEVNNTPPHPVLSFILIADYMLPPFDRILSICSNYITRLCEYEADQFAKQLGQEIPLRTALIKIYTHKLIFPVNDELYSICYVTHPSILERVRAIQR